MKKLYATSITLFLICFNLLSQTGFSYQGVLRDKLSGKLRVNEEIDLTAKLIQNGITVYTESHKVKTNPYGVFSIIIGKGSGQKPEFSPTFFITPDSTSVKETRLVVNEGKNEISNTPILGVPIAEVAKVALKAHIDFPAGTIVAFGGDVIPPGWLLCDGTQYNKNDYYHLYKVIGNNWGGGGNLFRVPDLQGVFLRGVNGENKDTTFFRDPDANKRVAKYNNEGNTQNKVGSYQKDEIEEHSHFVPNLGVGKDNGNDDMAWDRHSTYETKTTKTGGTETRPVNAYVNYIIKY